MRLFWLEWYCFIDSRKMCGRYGSKMGGIRLKWDFYKYGCFSYWEFIGCVLGDIWSVLLEMCGV